MPSFRFGIGSASAIVVVVLLVNSSSAPIWGGFQGDYFEARSSHTPQRGLHAPAISDQQLNLLSSSFGVI